MFPVRPLAPLVLAAVVLSATARAEPMPPLPPGTCDLPSPVADPRASLPHMAAAIAGGGPLEVLAIGSGTMANPRLRPDEDFPARATQALRDARPGLDVRLTVDARRGASATDMLARLRAALAEHPYRLVLWEVGAVEQLRASPPDELARTLAAGADATAAAGADLVLIDPQYEGTLPIRADADAYRAAFTAAAAKPGVALLSRDLLMRGWARDGGLDLGHVRRADRHRTLLLLHACVGRALAATILDGTGVARPAPR